VRFEFFGLPGTGKSYLCRELIQHQSESGIDSVVVSELIEDQSYLLFNLNKIRYSIMFSIRHPIATWKVNLFAELYKSETDNHAVVIEQGILQAIWSLEMLSDRNIAEALVDVYCRWLPSRVIVIEPPDSQFYIKHLTARDQGRSQFDTLGEDEIKQSLSCANNATENILNLVTKKRPEIETLRLINDHQVDIALIDQWICSELGVNLTTVQTAN